MTKRDDDNTTMTLDGFLREVPQSLPDDIEFETDGGPTTTREALAFICLDEALSLLDLATLAQPGPLAMVVTVPSQGWVGPIRGLIRRRWHFEDAASNTRKKPGAHDTHDEGSRLTDALSAGGRILGVSHSPTALLPAALISAADVMITVRPPSDRGLRRLIRWVTGKPVRTLPKGAVSGLDIDALCAAIRQGSTPTQCVRRLVAASKALAAGDPTLDDVPHVRDLVGYGDDATDWALKLVSDIKAWRAAGADPAAFKRLDRSVCLFGPAGTGKTQLARAVAKSANLPIVVSSVGSLFTSGTGYLDSVLRAFDDVFARAVACNGVLLLDELDALPDRATLDSRHREWWTTVIGHVLSVLDGAVSGDAGRIVVIGCTNHVEHLDAALVRPGRLRPIKVPLPSRDDLVGILRQHLGGDLPGVDLSIAARLGNGATGAVVADWVKRARLDANAAARPMTLADLLARIAPADKRPLAKIRTIARHEASHAAGLQILGAGEVLSVTIVANGDTEGCTEWRQTPEGLPSRDRLETHATAYLCGRAADEVFGVAHAGAGGMAQSDLGIATRLAASIHVSYGLGGKLAFRAASDGVGELMKYDRDLVDLVEKDLARLHQRALAFVRDHRDLIEAIAHRLVDERVIVGDDLRRMIADAKVVDAPTTPADVQSSAPVAIRGGRHA